MLRPNGGRSDSSPKGIHLDVGKYVVYINLNTVGKHESRVL